MLLLPPFLFNIVRFYAPSLALVCQGLTLLTQGGGVARGLRSSRRWAEKDSWERQTPLGVPLGSNKAEVSLSNNLAVVSVCARRCFFVFFVPLLAVVVAVDVSMSINGCGRKCSASETRAFVVISAGRSKSLALLRLRCSHRQQQQQQQLCTAATRRQGMHAGAISHSVCVRVCVCMPSVHV